MTETMKAAVFEGHERIVLEEKPMPSCGPNDAIVKVSLTAICGTDSHIWREQYPVEQGRIVGHEPVGTFHRLGEGVSGFEVGDRVLVGAITPCGTCFYCQSHNESQCSGHEVWSRSAYTLREDEPPPTSTSGVVNLPGAGPRPRRRRGLDPDPRVDRHCPLGPRHPRV